MTTSGQRVAVYAIVLVTLPLLPSSVRSELVALDRLRVAPIRPSATVISCVLEYLGTNPDRR